MAKGSGFTGGRSSGVPRGAWRASASSSSRPSAISRMWSEPATARQIAALKANGNFDGKYFSKGRAGQVIGQSVRNERPARAASTESVRRAFNLLNDAVPEQRISQPQPQSLTPALSEREAAHEVALATTEDQFVVLEEGIPMSQLVPVPVRNIEAGSSIASVVPLTASVTPDATPFAYVPELVATLLTPLVATTDPSQVRALEKALTIAKGVLAKSLTRARNDLVGVLRDAPSGAFASPEAKADEILWNACSADLEHQLIKVTQSAKGKSQPSKVIDELLAQVHHRVELALIEAQDMVEISKIQAALPPAPKRGYEPCWGEITGVKPFGAFVLLPSGESGLLHVSELQRLNGGRRVEDAAILVNVGQSVYVRVTGKNEKGQLSFALVSEA